MDDAKEKNLKQKENQKKEEKIKKEEKPKKENNQKNQIIVSVFMLTIAFLAGMYVSINFKDNLPLIMGVAAGGLVSSYILTNAILTFCETRAAKREEHFENLHKSQKASYIILKKNFDELEDKFRELEELSNLQKEEIINAQKGVSKVSINRSKQNTDALIESNEKLLEKLNGFEDIYNTKFASFSEEQAMKLSDMERQGEGKIQDLITELKNMELRLNQVIVDRTNAMMSAPIAQESLIEVPFDSESMMGVEPIVDLEPIAELEEIIADGVLAEKSQSEAEAEPVVEPEPEPVATPVVEEKPPMPDMSDPNKMMSPDDIAALLANMNAEPEPAPVVEEKPPMPDLSDPNKMMSPEDIAALFANL